MKQKSPTQAEWRQLYALMDRAKEAAPWQWMEETDIFAVQNPETGDLGFVSVMGSLGEHLAVAAYLGEEGLAGFLRIQYAGPYLSPDMVLNVPQLQASFEDRNTLHQKDRDVIKQLGLKYRGKQAWPQFQSYAPGMAPWYVTAVEARFLAHVLEQTLDVAVRLRDDPALLETDEGEYLVRTPTKQDGKWVWHDERRPVKLPESRSFSVYYDRQVMAALKQLPATMGRIDVDFFWMPTPVLGEGARPYHPYMLLIVEPASGMIVGNDTMIAEQSLDEMWAMMPMKVGQTLARLRLRPGFIRTTSERVAAYLQPLADELDIELQLLDDLSEMENIKQMLVSFLMRQ